LNGYISGSDYIASNDRMINELGKKWKEVVMAYLKYYAGVFLEGLRKTMIHLNISGL
jgi:hypothetical protein